MSDLKEKKILHDCGHYSETICASCAREEITKLSEKILTLYSSYKNLEKKLDLLQQKLERPLCWSCRFGTCTQISLPKISNNLPEEHWKDSQNDSTFLDIWQIVCHFPGHIPGISANRFTCSHVLECNNFEATKLLEKS